MKKGKQKSSIKAILLAVFVSGSLWTATIQTAQARETVWDYTGLGIGQTTVFYDSSIGMPTSEANAIAQTSDGFIWIGSYSGLIRYDGNIFFRYDASTGISNVVSLFVDSADRLWIGTNDNGIARMEKGQLTFYGKEEGLRSDSIRSIAQDEAGNILIATTQGMAYVDTKDQLHLIDDDRINGRYVCEIHADDRGVIYCETLEGDFFSVRQLAVWQYYFGKDLGENVISCIFPDPEREGYVYLGTEGSEIIHGDMDHGMTGYEVIQAPKQTNINCLRMVDDTLWICADDGIAHIDRDGTYTKLQRVDMTNSVDDMMEDLEGNLWFASSRQGVMKVTGSIFTDINRIAGMENVVVNTTCRHGDDLFIGTDTGLIILDRDYYVKNTPLTKLLKNTRIRSIKEDSRKNLWLCTYSDYGLICMDQSGTITQYNMQQGLSSNRVRTLMEMSDGTVVASTSGGVHFLRDGEIVETYDGSSGLSNTEILCICEGEDGELYLGSDGNGLYILDGQDIIHLGQEDGLGSEVILRIKKDTQRGIYWIVTSNSLAYMKDRKITTITDFPYANNFDMFFDENGRIWVLSSNGIYVVSGEDMLANKDIDYILYDSESGLPYVTTANSRNYLSPEGELFISGTNGVSMVNINDARGMSADVSLQVPYVEADDEYIYTTPGQRVVIPAGCKRLNIYSFVLTYSLVNPRVTYYLEGFDDEIITTSQRDLDVATYTNLNGGRYVFHLSTVNVLTGEEEETMQLTIIKQKAFFEQWWFWLLVALAAAGLIAAMVLAYIRHKTASLLRKQQEQQTLINQVIRAFAKCIDMKDRYTNGHSFRVAKYTKMLAEKLNYTDREIENMYNIALLHDIGKISIPDKILNKTEALNDEEYAVMKQHSANGYEVLKDIKIAPDLALGAGYHHERLDGKGYPAGLSGEKIPMVAQVIAVADTFDAMYSTRPYRKKMQLDVVIERIKQVAGTQLNPDVVDKLVELADEGMLEDETVE